MGKEGTCPALQLGFFLQSLSHPSKHPGGESQELSWGMLGAQAADPGSGASPGPRGTSWE